MPTATADEVVHPFNTWIQTHHELDTDPLTDEEILANRRAYYGMVTYIDDKVGEIMDDLERMGLLEDTILMLTSDHGEMVGEHGMWFKRTFYEPSVKVPLIISGPKWLPSGQKLEEVVSLVDLSATLMELADVRDRVRWEGDMDGVSLVPLMHGRTLDWKNEAISEYYGEGALKPMIVLRKGSYKLVKVKDHDDLFFDLNRDPLEQIDRISEPEYAAIIARMQSRLGEQFDLGDIESRVLRSQQERLMIAETLQTGQTHRWQPPITGLTRDW